MRLLLPVLNLSLVCRQKGTCCEVFRGRGGWRLCSHQNGDESRVSRNLLPGALTPGSLNALLSPATTGLLTSFNTFPWNCHIQQSPRRAAMAMTVAQFPGPASGPVALRRPRERLFRRRAARSCRVFSHLDMPVRKQQTEWSQRVEPEKERGVRFKTRGSRHVSNST